MQFFRDPHDKFFTIISNSTIRDSRLSWAARGLLAWLLSHDESFNISEKSIVQAGIEGVIAVRSLLQELMDFGYLSRIQLRDKKGTFGKSDYRISESPRSVEPSTDKPRSVEPLTDEPRSVEPSTDEPRAENLTTVTIYKEEKKREENKRETVLTEISAKHDLEEKKLVKQPIPAPSNSDARARSICKKSFFSIKDEESQLAKALEDIEVFGDTENSKSGLAKNSDSLQKVNFSAPPKFQFELNSQQELEFYRLAIQHKLLGDRRLQEGNATAIVISALNRLKFGVPRLDDINLYQSYLNGSLAQKTINSDNDSRDIQKELFIARGMALLKGLRK